MNKLFSFFSFLYTNELDVIHVENVNYDFLTQWTKRDQKLVGDFFERCLIGYAGNLFSGY